MLLAEKEHRPLDRSVQGLVRFGSIVDQRVLWQRCLSDGSVTMSALPETVSGLPDVPAVGFLPATVFEWRMCEWEGKGGWTGRSWHPTAARQEEAGGGWRALATAGS